MKINFPEKKFIISLFSITLTLAILSILGTGIEILFGAWKIMGINYLFNFGSEQNIPTIFTTFLFLLAALLQFFIYLNTKKSRISRYWIGLFLLFIYLAIDEVCVVHERILRTAKQIFSSANFNSHFIIMATVFIITVIFLFYRFLFLIPKKYLLIAILSAIVYLVGAVGFEVISIFYLKTSKGGFILEMISTIEELLEITGIILYISFILKYIKNELDEQGLIIKIT